jgi:hypothetical protein
MGQTPRRRDHSEFVRVAKAGLEHFFSYGGGAMMMGTLRRFKQHTIVAPEMARALFLGFYESYRGTR